MITGILVLAKVQIRSVNSEAPSVTNRVTSEYFEGFSYRSIYIPGEPHHEPGNADVSGHAVACSLLLSYFDSVAIEPDL